MNKNFSKFFLIGILSSIFNVSQNSQCSEYDSYKMEIEPECISSSVNPGLLSTQTTIQSYSITPPLQSTSYSSAFQQPVDIPPPKISDNFTAALDQAIKAFSSKEICENLFPILKQLKELDIEHSPIYEGCRLQTGERFVINDKGKEILVSKEYQRPLEVFDIQCSEMCKILDETCLGNTNILSNAYSSFQQGLTKIYRNPRFTALCIKDIIFSRFFI